MSAFAPPLTLHQCNTYVVPLASWLEMVAFTLFILAHLHGHRGERWATILRGIRNARYRFFFPHHFTGILILAALALSILEVARLGGSRQDLGALFFTPIGVACAFVKHYLYVAEVPSEHASDLMYRVEERPTAETNRLRHRSYKQKALDGGRLLISFFWFLQLVLQSLKLALVIQEKNRNGNGPAAYTKLAQITDVALIIGLFTVIQLLECISGQSVQTRVDKGIPTEDSPAYGPGNLQGYFTVDVSGNFSGG